MKKHTKKEGSKKHKVTRDTVTPCGKVKALITTLKAKGAEVVVKPAYTTVILANRRVALLNRIDNEKKFYVRFAFKPNTPNAKKNEENTAWPFLYTGSKPEMAITKTFKALRRETAKA